MEISNSKGNMKNRLIILVTILLCMGGCTQYNGYIGDIFGSWSLDKITENGLVLQMTEETVICFQNQIVEVVKRQEPPLSSVSRYGNFEKTKDILILKFQIKPTENGNTSYMTPNWMYLPLDEPSIPMEIKELNGKRMVLQLMTDSGSLQYTFSRTW